MHEVPSPESFASTSETEVRIEKKIGEAFERNPFPLSEKGNELRARLSNEKHVELSELPTVENPHLELFDDFDVSPEAQHEVFGFENLSNIQVTKGCRHKCTFCAADASGSVETMPFAAVLKAAEIKKREEQVVGPAWEQYKKDFAKKFGRGPRDSDNITGKRREEAVKFFEEHPLGRLVIKLPRTVVQGRERDYAWLPTTPRALNIITNYYDSDPLDYRDRFFPHRDGTPADFGDVVSALATEYRPIHITTAGVDRDDKIGIRALDKLAALYDSNPYLFSNIRISVNKYEAIARKDPERYVEMILTTAWMLRKMHINVLTFTDRNDDPDKLQQYRERILTPIIRGITYYNQEKEKDLPDIKVTASRVSFYSGPMKTKKAVDDHHDVMTCMPGKHIWPDGTVADQQRELDMFMTKGARPTSSAMKLYTLKK